MRPAEVARRIVKKRRMHSHADDASGRTAMARRQSEPMATELSSVMSERYLYERPAPSSTASHSALGCVSRRGERSA